MAITVPNLHKKKKPATGANGAGYDAENSATTHDKGKVFYISMLGIFQYYRLPKLIPLRGVLSEQVFYPLFA